MGRQLDQVVSDVGQLSTPSESLILGKAGVIRPPLIKEFSGTIGARRPSQSRDGIYNQSKMIFLGHGFPPKPESAKADANPTGC
jgi:hypothetical protein